MADKISLLSEQFHQSVAIMEESPWDCFQKVVSKFRLKADWTKQQLKDFGNYNRIIQHSVEIKSSDSGTIQNLVGPYYSNSSGEKHDIADALLKTCFLLERFPYLKSPEETSYMFSHLNLHLLNLVKLFIPNKSENSSHTILGHILKCLHEHGKGRVSIDRSTLSGSSGKNTSLGSFSDVDIVVFLNDRRPPFQHDIYESVADILKTGLKKDLEFKDLVIGKRSLQFTLMGVEVDLLFAHSFDQKKRQLETAIEYLAKIPEDCRSDDTVSFYSTCFSEASVEFIEQQHGNTNIFVRMAKLWASMIMVISKFDSKSYLIELLAVKAAEMDRAAATVLNQRGAATTVLNQGGAATTVLNQEGAANDRNDKNFSFLVAFYHFLSLISNYPTMNIVWTKYYAETVVPSSIRCQRPLVLDPANPFNNVGRQDRVPWVELQKAAKQTLVVVNDYLDRIRWSTSREGWEKLSSKLVSEDPGQRVEGHL